MTKETCLPHGTTVGEQRKRKVQDPSGHVKSTSPGTFLPHKTSLSKAIHWTSTFADHNRHYMQVLIQLSSTHNSQKHRPTQRRKRCMQRNRRELAMQARAWTGGLGVKCLYKCKNLSSGPQHPCTI